MIFPSFRSWMSEFVFVMLCFIIVLMELGFFWWEVILRTRYQMELGVMRMRKHQRYLLVSQFIRLIYDY